MPRVYVRKDGADGLVCSLVCFEMQAADGFYGLSEWRVARVPRPSRQSTVLRVALARVACDICGLNLGFDRDDDDSGKTPLAQ